MNSEFPDIDMEQWRSQVDQELKGAPFEDLQRETPEGMILEPLYSRENSPAHNSERPGDFPFTRGAMKSEEDGRSWRIIQRFEQEQASDLNEALRRDLESGVDGAWIRLDRCARLGKETTDSANRGLMGKDGACLYDRDQLKTALAGVNWSNRSLYLDVGGNAKAAAALLFSALDDLGHKAADMDLRFEADPFSAALRDANIPGNLEALVCESADLARLCHSDFPHAKACRASSEAIHECGAHVAQELAFILGSALAQLRAMEKAGLSVDEAATQIGFRMPMSRDIFLSIAKLRALRKLWAYILQSCDVKKPEAAEIHATTSRRTLSRRDQWVNILRSTTQSFAAVAANADAVTTSSFDAMQGDPWWPKNMMDFVHGLRPEESAYARAYGKTSRLGRRVAKNTQILLDEETQMGRVLDPAGGSHYVETLTEELCANAWELFSTWERDGGLTAVLRNGKLKKEVEARAQGLNGRIRRRKEAITGVSEYPLVDDLLAQQAENNIAELCQDQMAQQKQKQALYIASEDIGDLVHAAGKGATLADLSATLESRDLPEVFPAPLAFRDADGFEELRDFADAMTAEVGRPQVFVINLGELADYLPRNTFVKNLYTSVGFGILECPSTAGTLPKVAAEIIVEAFEKSGAEVAILCGQDTNYAYYGPTIVKALRASLGTETPIFIAGRLDDMKQPLQDEIPLIPVYTQCDMVQILGSTLYLSGRGEEFCS